MSDSDPDLKQTAAPSWQTSSTAATEEKSASVIATEPPKQPSRDAVLDIARTFLEDEKIREASVDEKIAFLESKGLGRDVIHELLGASRNIEATNMDPSTPSPSVSTAATQAMKNAAASSPVQASKRDSPPIITYPEFLTTPPQPAPLITAQRLLTTLYVFGGLSALVYGTSTYLIAPMVASLTESRHDLANVAQTNLDKMISKLEGMVSEVPQGHIPVFEHIDEEESDSDPTEMFHRDIGVQTSLPGTPSPSRPRTPPAKESALEDQASRLLALKEHIQGLNDAAISEGQDMTELNTTMDVLREYLNSLAFQQPSYTYGSYGTQEKKEENDKISELKAQIRQVKGVLLSARSFPSSTRVR